MENKKNTAFARAVRRAKAKYRKFKAFVIFPEGRASDGWAADTLEKTLRSRSKNMTVYLFDDRQKKWKPLPEKAGRFRGFLVSSELLSKLFLVSRGDFIFCVKEGTFFQLCESVFPGGLVCWTDSGIYQNYYSS